MLGAGVVGVNTGLALARRGLQVALIDQFAAGHERGSSHGQGRIIRYLYRKDQYARMMRAAFESWQRLEKESGKKNRP